MLNKKIIIKTAIGILFILFMFSLKVKAVSNNPILDNITIDAGELSPAFSFITTEYFVNVSTEVEKIEITAVPDDENATIEIEGNDNLKEGLNVAVITVIAEDGVTKKVYNINISKGEPDEVNANLKELLVTGHEIIPKFDKDRVNYVVELKTRRNRIRYFGSYRKQ